VAWSYGELLAVRRAASRESAVYFSLVDNALHAAISPRVRKQLMHISPLEFSTQILLHGDGGTPASARLLMSFGGFGRLAFIVVF